MNHPQRSSQVPPSSSASRAPRHDLFGPIHKAIRFALCDMLARLGTTSFADERAASAMLVELETVLEFCERHSAHENTFIEPALEGRAVEVFDDGHARLARLVEEVRSLASAVKAAPLQKRDLAGRTLYLHVSAYVAENLSHMAHEEQVLQPLLEWLRSDEELRAIQARLSGSLGPAEKLESATWMLRGASPVERAALVHAFLAVAPRDAIIGMLDAIRPKLAPADWTDLAARCGLVA